MKKIIIGCVLLLVSSFCFAEHLTLFGITFGTSKQDMKKFNIDKQVETPMEKAFDAFTNDIEVEVTYDRNDKLNRITISSGGKDAYLFEAYWVAYFLENLNCKRVDNIFYNDKLVAVIQDKYDADDGEFDGTYIYIGEMADFKNIMDKCIKGNFN